VSLRVLKRAPALVIGAALAAISCGGTSEGKQFAYPSKEELRGKASGSAVRMRWTADLVPAAGGLYRPVERAAPAVDALHERVYVGTTQRFLYAFRGDGRREYRYTAESAIEAEPTIDPVHEELYLATSRGIVHALSSADGSVRWKAELGQAISKAGVLSEDALYLVTDEDSVIALSRVDGSVLWRYKREPRAGLQVAGHAGLLFAEHRLITGFTDGSIVALAANDGRVLWSVDTTLDFADPAQAEKGFVDVDTTPVQIDDLVYVASFLGGFYAIEAAHGAVRMRNPELTNITSIAAGDDALILGSAKFGVLCLDVPSLAPRWRRNVTRGAPASVSIANGNVYVTESRGALLAMRLRDGLESGRLQTLYGFTSTPNLEGRRGFILGNAGTLYAFEL
jgi:outer membrane protein assembly factor BamB